MMITEDYISFETAKLLKEKGFNEYCRFVYNAGLLCSVASLNCHWNEGYGELIQEKQNSDFGKYDNAISAPTLAMAMKWLREKHNIFIGIVLFTYPTIEKIVWTPDVQTFDSVFPDASIEYDTYEKACDSAIKYCLENLI